MAYAHVSFMILNVVTTDQTIERKVKPGFKYVGTHMIFDIKMDGKFTCKDRLLEVGHETENPQSTTNSSSVNMGSVILEFLIAGLNDLDICACNIGNAYLNASCWKNVDQSRIIIWE